jgi:hypothetical protein
MFHKQQDPAMFLALDYVTLLTVLLSDAIVTNLIVRSRN